MESNEDTRFFRVRSPILCNFVDTSSLYPLDPRRLSWESGSILKEIIPTCHSFQFFKDRSLNFLTVLDVDFSRVNSKTFETSFLERRNGTRIANKIGVTARVHSRFACSRGVHKAARSWPSITALSATATNWAPIIALMHQPRRARGVTVKLPAGPLAKKGRCYRESSCKCARTIVRR